MAMLPLRYNFDSLWHRRSATLLTVFSVAATVAVIAGVLALQQGFQNLFEVGGREDVAVFLRPGATTESDSAFPFDRADVLIKTLDEIELDENDRPLAARECYLAVRLRKRDGGETNVPIRGVEPASLALAEPKWTWVEGRPFERGADEIVVGRSLTDRIQNCRVGDVLEFNTARLTVVGIFDYDGPFGSEIWGDLERISQALELPVCSRVVAKLRPDVDLEAFAERLGEHQEVPASVIAEPEYLRSQTTMLAGVLSVLGTLLGVVMGAAAVFTGTNTMLAAISARTHEIGILLSLGFRPVSIFCSFLLESLLLGLTGGLIGCLLVVPLHGMSTGTTNWNTFTEVAFAFRLTPGLLGVAVGFALLLGLLAGAWPAWRAAQMAPTVALRRRL